MTEKPERRGRTVRSVQEVRTDRAETTFNELFYYSVVCSAQIVRVLHSHTRAQTTDGCSEDRHSREKRGQKGVNWYDVQQVALSKNRKSY